MVALILILLKLVIFRMVIQANAEEIIAFNRACQFQTRETDDTILSITGHITYPKGSVIDETKMILWRFRMWVDRFVPVFWRKPIYGCCTCMASIHGIIPFLFTAYITLQPSLLWIPYGLFYILVLSGVATKENEA